MATTVGQRVPAHFARINEQFGTPLGIWVYDFSRTQGDLMAKGIRPEALAGYLKPFITQGRLTAAQLAEVKALATNEQRAALDEHPDIKLILGE